MLRYIIGGVALAATGYGLKKYLDGFDAPVTTSYKDKSKVDQDTIEPNETDDFGFCNDETVKGDANYALSYLIALQNRLLKIEANISESKILNLNEIDVMNFHDFINRTQTPSLYCSPVAMMCYMIEKIVLNMENTQKDIKEDKRETLTNNLIELNNRLTKALKELRPDTNKEISDIFHEVSKIFKEEVYE